LIIRIYIAILITFIAIGIDYYIRRDFKKSLIASGSFLVLLSLFAIGNALRTILPLFLAHITLILIGWASLFYYLIRGRYIWWSYFLGVITILIFLGLNFIDGSRYEP